MRRGRRLAVDVGDARIGVASCDPDGILATPVETVPGPRCPGRPAAAGGNWSTEYEPIEVVVGLPSLPQAGARARPRPRSVPSPRNWPAGRAGAGAAGGRADDHGHGQLRALRASGVKAKKGRSVIDQAAAVVILQSALETERMSGRAPGRVRRSGCLIAVR